MAATSRRSPRPRPYASSLRAAGLATEATKGTDMTTTTEPRSVTSDEPFDGYTPALARRLEERIDDVDNMIAIAFHVSARLSPVVADVDQILNVVVEDIGQRYRSHRERTPNSPMNVAQFVDHYISQVEGVADADPFSRATKWEQHIERLDTVTVNHERAPSGVSRRLRCLDPCCIDDPHADMALLIDGQLVGGTRYNQDEQWVSWGPAGKSTGHRTRSDAEVVQLDTYRTRH